MQLPWKWECRYEQIELEMAQDVIKIGTRGSALALKQAGMLSDELARLGTQCEIVIIKTSGDARQGTTDSAVHDKREWVLELESALLDRKIDLAIHSGKDLPVDVAAGTEVSSILKREVVEDVIVCNPSLAKINPRTLSELPAGTRIGCASLRRQAYLKARWPQLLPFELRGNVTTRLERIRESKGNGEGGRYSAALLAGAGVRRLGCIEEISFIIPVADILPAVAQGILAVQFRNKKDDCEVEGLKLLHRNLSVLIDKDTEAAFLGERSFISTLGADCRSAVGVYLKCDGEEISIQGCVLSVDGKEHLSGFRNGKKEDSVAIGRELGQDFIARGAEALLRI